MKTPAEITQYVLNEMYGIEGCQSNDEFYVEFDDRLRRALEIDDEEGLITIKVPKDSLVLTPNDGLRESENLYKKWVENGFK